MEKRGRPKAQSLDEERRERVAHLIALLYDGNQRRAARATNISQAQISRIVGGQRPPTERLLESFARLPGVNPRWLFDGEGEPLLPSTAGTLPVAHCILPGLPDEHIDLLTGDRHPVATAMEQGSRYWLALDPSSPLVQTFDPQFLPGDLLLLETSRNYLDRLDVIHGQLCAVAVRWDCGLDYLMAKVVVDGSALLAELITRQTCEEKAAPYSRRIPRKVGSLKGSTSTVGTAATERVMVKGQLPAGSGGVRSTSKSPEAAKGNPSSGRHRLASVEDVVGLTMHLERPFPSPVD